MKRIPFFILIFVLLFGLMFVVEADEGDYTVNQTLCGDELNVFAVTEMLDQLTLESCAFQKLADGSLDYVVYYRSDLDLEATLDIIFEVFSGFEADESVPPASREEIIEYMNELGILSLRNGREGFEDFVEVVFSRQEDGSFSLMFTKDLKVEDERYTFFLDENLNLEFFDGELIDSLFGGYDLVDNFIRIYYEEGASVYRFISFDVGDDYAQFEKMILSDETIDAVFGKVISGPVYEEFDGYDQLSFETLDHLKISLSLNPEEQVIGIIEFNDDFPKLLSKYGGYAETFPVLDELTSVSDLIEADVNPYEVIVGSDMFDRAYYEIAFNEMGMIDFRYLAWLTSDDYMNSYTEIGEWMSSFDEEHQSVLFAGLDQYRERYLMTFHYFILGEEPRAQMQNVFDQNFVPALFNFGELDGVLSSYDVYDWRIQFAPGDANWETRSIAMIDLDEDYEKIVDLILENRYQLGLKLKGATDISVSDDGQGHDELSYSINGIFVELIFLEEFETLGVYQSINVDNENIIDFVEIEFNAREIEDMRLIEIF